jgi:hypothetical protein
MFALSTSTHPGPEVIPASALKQETEAKMQTGKEVLTFTNDRKILRSLQQTTRTNKQIYNVLNTQNQHQKINYF